MNIGNESLDPEDSFLPTRKRFQDAIENISMPSGCDDFLNVSSFTQSPSFLSDLRHSKFSEASDLNNTLNCTDYLSKEIDEGLKAKRFLDKNLEADVNSFKSLLNEVSRARKRWNASKFVVEALKDVFENSSELPPLLKKQCCQRIRFLSLLNNPQNSELLEIMSLNSELEPFQLTTDEKYSIHSILNETLDRKITQQKIDNDVLIDLFGNSFKSIPVPGSTITEENVKIISLINEICKTIRSSFQIASSIATATKELGNFHIEKFRKLHEEEMGCLSSRTKLLELKLKNLNSLIQNAIIQENDSVNEAVDVLCQKLRTLLDESEYSLQKSEDVKQTYDRLKDTKFDEVLRDYLEVRESLKHKQWALKQIAKSGSFLKALQN